MSYHSFPSFTGVSEVVSDDLDSNEVDDSKYCLLLIYEHGERNERDCSNKKMYD